MTKQEALDYIAKSPAQFFTYGPEGSEHGKPAKKIVAFEEIEKMEEEVWNDGRVYPCTRHGVILKGA
jgi:hypothetical protein